MGMLDKMKFWKKDDDLSLDNNPFGNVDNSQNNNSFMDSNNSFSGNSLDKSMDNSLNEPLHNNNSFSSSNSQQQNSFNDPTSATEMIKNGKISEVKQQIHPNQDVMQKDIEILSSKLDAIKAGIESMNQRLQNIERIQKNGEVRF